MQVPFIDLKRGIEPFKEAVYKRWKATLDQCEFVGGKSVQDLELAIAKEAVVNHVVSCANGTDAIILALQAKGIGRGHIVAIPNLTFWATYEAVVNVGATPLLIDSDPSHWQLNFTEFKSAFEKYRFQAAIIVHLLGWAHPELKEIRKYCAENEIILLEDGAQSMAVQVDDESVFSGAEISTTSFYPAKVLGTCMDGGAVFTRDQKTAERVRSLANHGRATHYSYGYVGWNSRMSGLSAAFMLEALPHFRSSIDTRRNAFDRYVDQLRRFEGYFRVVTPPKGVQGNGYLNVLNFCSQASVVEVVEKLKVRGVGTGRVYPETMAQQAPAQGVAILASDLAHSTEYCKTVVNLPLFSGITDHEVDYVVSQLVSVVKGN